MDHEVSLPEAIGKPQRKNPFWLLMATVFGIPLWLLTMYLALYVAGHLSGEEYALLAWPYYFFYALLGGLAIVFSIRYLVKSFRGTTKTPTVRTIVAAIGTCLLPILIIQFILLPPARPDLREDWNHWLRAHARSYEQCRTWRPSLLYDARHKPDRDDFQFCADGVVERTRDVEGCVDFTGDREACVTHYAFRVTRSYQTCEDLLAGDAKGIDYCVWSLNGSMSYKECASRNEPLRWLPQCQFAEDQRLWFSNTRLWLAQRRDRISEFCQQFPELHSNDVSDLGCDYCKLLSLERDETECRKIYSSVLASLESYPGKWTECTQLNQGQSCAAYCLTIGKECTDTTHDQNYSRGALVGNETKELCQSAKTGYILQNCSEPLTNDSRGQWARCFCTTPKAQP